MICFNLKLMMITYKINKILLLFMQVTKHMCLFVVMKCVQSFSRYTKFEFQIAPKSTRLKFPYQNPTRKFA